MRIIQRLGYTVKGKRMDEIIAAHKRNPGCFNEVWLSTLYGYPTLKTHKEEAEALAEEAKKLRSAGIRVSMQLSNSIGHGQYSSARDCKGLVYPDSPAERLVGHDGQVADYAFCWWGKHFRAYLDAQVRLYISAVRPHEFWVDDDLRARNHAPVEFGCFCPDCLGRFNQKHGHAFRREELVAEFLHGRGEVREQYIAFLREGLSSLMELICRAVKESCAETVVALQNGPNGPYTGYGHGYLFDAIRRTTGDIPMYRPGAGAYNDHDPNLLADKVYELEYQCSQQPSYVKVICPEIESTPDTAMGKSMAGTALETAMNLAWGATDISYAMLGPLPEELAFYEKGFALFSAQRAYWEHLAEGSAQTVAGGLQYGVSKCLHLRPMKETETLYDFNVCDARFDLKLARNGLPITYRETAVTLLSPKEAARMTEEELRALLEKNVITDGETVALIQERGISLGFQIGTPGEFDTLHLTEVYTSHRANRNSPPTFSAGFFSPGNGNHRYLLAVPQDAQILSTYAPSEKLAPITEDPANPYGYASVIFSPKEGGKWAVLGYGLWKTSVPAARRDRILQIADELSLLPAKLLSPMQAYVACRVNGEGKTAAVSLLNCTVGEEKDICVLVRNPQGERFTFESQYDGKQALPWKKTADGYEVRVPKLSPWSVGTVFAEEDD